MEILWDGMGQKNLSHGQDKPDILKAVVSNLGHKPHKGAIGILQGGNLKVSWVGNSSLTWPERPYLEFSIFTSWLCLNAVSEWTEELKNLYTGL